MFFHFLLFFLEFSRPGRVRIEFWTKIFFSLFLGLSHHVLDRNSAKMRFFNFSNFLAFFLWNFLARVEQEWNSGLKFFSLFLCLSHPGLDRNNAGMIFLDFRIFFGIFQSGSRRNEIRDNFFFFFSFSANVSPIWIETMLELCFSIF